MRPIRRPRIHRPRLYTVNRLGQVDPAELARETGQPYYADATMSDDTTAGSPVTTDDSGMQTVTVQASQSASGTPLWPLLIVLALIGYGLFWSGQHKA